MASSSIDFSVAADSEVQALVDRATSGDPVAAATLIDAIAPILRMRVARALSRRRAQSRGRALGQDLDDLVQETFAGLFADRGRVLRSWDPARGLGFPGFVGLLAEREVGRRMRVRKRNPWTEEPTAHDALALLGGQVEGLALRMESRDLLRRIVDGVAARLSPRGRCYFQLLLIEARPVQAVADETGASPDALYAWRSRISRVVREVHAELGGRAAGQTACSKSTPKWHAARVVA